MFYRFSSIVGRMIPATQHAAYVPQGLRVAAVESQAFRFDSAKTVAAVAPEYSTIAGSKAETDDRVLGHTPSSQKYKEKITEVQKQWSTQHTAVWQKTTTDTVIYRVTIGLVISGVLLALWDVWKMSWPKKVEE